MRREAMAATRPLDEKSDRMAPQEPRGVHAGRGNPAATAHCGRSTALPRMVPRKAQG